MVYRHACEHGLAQKTQRPVRDITGIHAAWPSYTACSACAAGTKAHDFTVDTTLARCSLCGPRSALMLQCVLGACNSLLHASMLLKVSSGPPQLGLQMPMRSTLIACHTQKRCRLPSSWRRRRLCPLRPSPLPVRPGSA